jgi:hypothetical protein
MIAEIGDMNIVLIDFDGGNLAKSLRMMEGLLSLYSQGAYFV